MARARDKSDALSNHLDGVVTLLGRGFNQALKRDGLRPSDIQMLELVERGEVILVKDAAQALGVSRQAVAKVLGQLAEQGLLGGRNHRGAERFSPSARGRAVLAKVRKRREKLFSGVLAPLSSKERAQLAQLLGRILDAARAG